MSTLLASMAEYWPLIVTCVALWIGYETWNVLYFKRCGLPGPTPLPLIGNVLHFKKGFHFAMLDYLKLGKVVGVFLFRQPIFMVYDLDMIKEITVKSFSKFVNHKSFVLENKPFDKAVTALRDQHWKDVRNIITPTFSALKMKQMSDLVNECCDTLVENIALMHQKGNNIEVVKLFGGFTMDGIAKCAFGLKVDSQKNPDDPFVKNARAIVGDDIFTPTVMLAGMFPPFGKLMNYMEVGMFPKSVVTFFSAVVDKAVSLRKQGGGQQRKDFLQLMANAHEDNQEKVENAKEEEEDLHNLVYHQQDDTSFQDTKKKTMLTKDEIFAQGMFFFLAGYETTNITLSFAAYALATVPDVQDRLIAEIDEVTPTRESVSYHSIAKMPYLDAFICETMRLYPAATTSERECNETFTYNGVTIRPGCQVFMPIFAIHRDPTVWPDPEKFDPTRFSKENREGRHPFAWMPFGAGPRNCIGMRFALMEVKMALVRVLQKYRFEVAPETVVPVKLGVRSVKPKEGITLRVTERS